MTRTYVLAVAEKIYYGIRDPITVQEKYNALWQYPMVLESLLNMLRHHADESYQGSFEIICRLLCPSFLQILDDIGLAAEKA